MAVPTGGGSGFRAPIQPESIAEQQERARLEEMARGGRPVLNSIGHYGPWSRAWLGANGQPYLKTARIMAVQVDGPFIVDTDHGQMNANAGDWLATNHPDDDANSDVWPISASRFAASYAPASPVTSPTAREAVEEELRGILAWARAEAAEYRTSDPVRGRAASLIATHVEDALRTLILPVP